MIACVLDATGLVTNTIVLADDADAASFGAQIGPADVGIGWSFDGTNWSAPSASAPAFDELRAEKLAAIQTEAGRRLITGASVEGELHVALDDGSRTDLTAMAATATAAASGAVTWPESYSRGWISIENVRIPLPTPAAGLTLAAKVGDYYAAIIQHRRDLKDAALAAETADALDAIDISAGWPA